MKNLLMACLAGVIASGAPPVENWAQFRGPGARGIADDPRLPERWSETENVVWKTGIPGHGWSSPVVWGDRVFVTAAISAAAIETPKKGLYFGGNRGKTDVDHRWVVYAVDWDTGKIVWDREVHRGVPESARHLKNTFASETPVTDGERVYAYFGNVGLFCLDRKGKLLWSKKWEAFDTRYGWGTAASPVLHQGRLYILNDNDEESFLVALEAATGKEIWRAARDEKSNWATPYIWENKLRTEIVTSGTGKVRSYDLDGKVLWEFRGMSSIAIPTPFSDSGLLYLASGYVGDQNRPVYVIRPGASGDITLAAGETSSRHIAWYLPQAGPYNPSPLVYQGLYYTLFDRGFLTCHDAKTGKENYDKQRIHPETAAFTASPWAYNGKIFALSEDGDTFVIQAGPEYRLLGRNSLNEMSMATPAIANGSLVIRTASQLYRIGNR